MSRSEFWSTLTSRELNIQQCVRPLLLIHISMERLQLISWHLLKFLCAHDSVLLRDFCSKWVTDCEIHVVVEWQAASFKQDNVHKSRGSLFAANAKYLVIIYYCWFSLASSPSSSSGIVFCRHPNGVQSPLWRLFTFLQRWFRSLFSARTALYTHFCCKSHHIVT